MTECTCNKNEISVGVEKDEIIGGYVAVKRCESCGGEIDRVILGPSSKYKEWSEEDILEKAFND